MAGNQQNQNKSSADINLHAEVTVTQTYKRTHRQQNNRNYPILYKSKEILVRNYNNFKTIINRNYRRFSY